MPHVLTTCTSFRYVVQEGELGLGSGEGGGRGGDGGEAGGGRQGWEAGGVQIGLGRDVM